MDVAIECQDIEYIREHMTDTIKNWFLLFNNLFIFRCPAFIAFISKYPIQWLAEHLCELPKINAINIYRILEIFPGLLKSFIPIFIHENDHFQVFPLKCILEYDGPLFLPLHKLVPLIYFKKNDKDNIDKFFLKMYQECPHEFDRILNFKFMSPGAYYASLCWRKYSNRTNDELITQPIAYDNIIWRLILNCPIADTIEMIIENGPNNRDDIIHGVNVIIKNLDQLELIIDQIGPLDSTEIADHYIDCPERLTVLQKKYPDQPLFIPKEILKNGKESDIIYWAGITKLINYRYFKYLRPNILPYIDIYRTQLFDAIQNNLNWSVIVDIIHYYNYNIDPVIGLMLLRYYLDKCTTLIEDFDINPNFYLLDELGDSIGILYKRPNAFIKIAIENGARPPITDYTFEALIIKSIKKRKEIEEYIIHLHIIPESTIREIVEIKEYKFHKIRVME